MRTMVALGPEVVASLRAYMREKGVSFKQALNNAIRNGQSSPKKQKKRFHQRVYPMGVPSVPLRKAMQLAAALEDEEILRDLT